MATNFASNDDYIASVMQSEEDHRMSANNYTSRRITPTYRQYNLNRRPDTTSSRSSNQRTSFRDNDIVLVEDDDDDTEADFVRSMKRNNVKPNHRESEITTKKSSQPVAANTDSDEMLARKLQEQYDFELAQRLNKRDRTRFLHTHTKLPTSSAEQLFSPISVDSDDLDTPRANRHRQNDPNNENSSSPTNRVPASFQTDMLYHMARHKSPPSRQQHRSNRRNEASPSAATTITTTTTTTTTTRPVTTSRSDLESHVGFGGGGGGSNENRSREFGLNEVEPLVLPTHPPHSFNRNRNYRARQTDPMNNLASAFSILNNNGSINNLLEEVRRDDTSRLNSSRPQPPAPNRFDSASAMSLNQARYRNNGSSGGNYRNFGGRHFGDRSSQFLAGQNSALAFRFMNTRDFTPDDYEALLRLDEINCVKKTLTSSEINSLPCFDYKMSDASRKSRKDDEQGMTCSICYEDFASMDRIKALACSHKFHKKCIETWLKESRRCPLCQKDAISGE